MLYISPTNTKRFNLYHMEQNQIYIQDFFGNCTFYDYTANQARNKDKGKFYLCSKSIVYESDNKNVPLIKFKFEFMKEKPQFAADCIKFNTVRITAIKVLGNSAPEPFKIFEDMIDKISIFPTYQNVKNLQQWIVFLYEGCKKKNNYLLEESIYEMIIDKFNKKSFNMSKVQSVSQKPLLDDLSILTRQVLPLNTVYGYIFITDEKVYFEPFHNLSGNTVQKIEINRIQKLFKKRYELRQIGLEISAGKNKSYYFTFESENHRNKIYNILSKRVPVNCFKIDQLENITIQWQTRQISNFQYLMYLNQASNRSFSDLSQYPVYPWVIADYINEEIDINNPKIYRDLSKPIGALNEQRLQTLFERYENMEAPKFMYGSHYSTPGYVIGYLVRKKPEYMLKLQSGRFDKPDRLFKSIKDDWYNVMENPTSLKELIPQFYMEDSSFLKNYQNLDLGVRQNKKRVGDVKMPLWAKDDPELYLKINRSALESEHVSQNLHKWIDLIFGYRQRGQEAIKSFNLFHPFTYEGMIDIEKIKDPIEKMGIKCQINEFGQCPKQIFKIPHPSRNSNQPIFTDAFKVEDEDEIDFNKEEEFKSSPIKINSVKAIESSGLYAMGKPKVKTILSMGKQGQIRVSQLPKAHKSQINRCLHLKSKPNSLLTISNDGFLKIFDINQKTCTKSFKICQFNLSCIVMLKADESFAIGSWDNNIYLFNIVYGSKSKPFSAHDNSIIDLVYMPKRKTVISASWDCSVKTFRYVGNVLDNQDSFFDHENQITSLAVNSEENIVAFGDVEGNIMCFSFEEKQELFNLNINSQKIVRMHFIQNNIIIAAETQIRMVDVVGTNIGSYQIDSNNGIVSDIELDNEHLFITTTNKQFILYDVLQQKKIGNFFNDFTFSAKDRLPSDKGLTCIAAGNEGLFIAIGGISGSIYILRPI